MEQEIYESDTQRRKEQQKERIRRKYSVKIDPENYRYIPPRKTPDYYDEEVRQLVAIYVRVSTDDPRQTTSYELQKKYYEEFVNRHPNWTLVHIYADEGISGTSLKHRDAFNDMIADCKQGKISLIRYSEIIRMADLYPVQDRLHFISRYREGNPFSDKLTFVVLSKIGMTAYINGGNRFFDSLHSIDPLNSFYQRNAFDLDQIIERRSSADTSAPPVPFPVGDFETVM